MPTEERNSANVVKFVQTLLYDSEYTGKITPALIEEQIAKVINMKPIWGEGLDHAAVIDELIRRFSVWVGQDTTLKNEVGHKPWLNSERKKDWRYWQRYQDWLESKLSLAAIDALDQSTDSILGLLEDPLSQGTWDRRGLVVGHVQSGKTGSYTGLICKAADAGYKIIIVLAGMHNNLRSQTQIRLDEGFLGFSTNSDPTTVEYIGVGMGGREASIKPNCATNRSEKGDFNRRVARHLAITPEQRPWLFVVKKNKTVLSSLLAWVKNHVADTTDSDGRKVVNNLPLLVVDDEADHASVDTGEQVLDAEGVPNDDHQPTAINSLIRKILHSFNRAAYVGYTATPFANIFIHERGETKEEGKDLFPSSFIINLAAPSSYVGPSKVFGLQTPKGRIGGLPLVRVIDDHQSSSQFGWMPQKHKNGHLPLNEGKPTLPNSLIEAIDAFLLVCAIRFLRGQQNEHSSMLVHVTRFNSVQREVYTQINEHVRHLRQRITRGLDNEFILFRLKELWEKDFLSTTATILKSYPDEVPCQSCNWDDVLRVLADSIADIEIRMINGTAKDALDYAENQKKGLKVIAIGGDKLARGLTLEGLCVSYFLRASKMYDTLMQMGRWFGYRPNYIDLSRLYTTSELIEWFGHIADAAEELREEFNLMAASGSSPREYGLKVQSHPVLMVTSRLKMRTARNLMVSFSGQIVETTSLYKDSIIIENNLNVTKTLLDALGSPHEINPTKFRGERKDKWTGYIWSNISSSEVINFLSDYRTHPAAYKVNSSVLAEFVRAMSSNGELTSWTVALVGIASGESYSFSSDIKINMIKRTADKHVHDRYSIGRLLDPKDEAIDLDEGEWNAALALTRAAKRPDPARMQDTKDPDVPSGPAIRRVRGFGSTGIQPHPERGLLLLYVLDPNKSEIVTNGLLPPVVAFGISFPGSNSGLKVEYMVNNVLWEQEYGPAE